MAEAANIFTAQFSVQFGNPAVQIASSRPDRKHLQFQNSTGSLVFGGDSTVSATTGYPNTMVFDNYSGPLWVISTGGNMTVYVVEVY